MRWTNDWTGFFLIYFKWGYYLCVTPFRFEWDEKTTKYRLESNIIQKVASALMYTLLGIWYLKDLRKIPVDNLYKNPDVYFSLAFNLNAIQYHIGVLGSSFWRRQNRFLAIVNFNCAPYAKSTVKNKILVISLCCIFAILPLLYSCSGYQVSRVTPSSTIWDPSLMLRCLVVEGRFAFFLNGTNQTTCISSSSLPEFHEISVIDVIVGVLAFLMETARQVVGFYSDFFPLICCLSLWTSTGSFREILERDQDQNDDLEAGQSQNKTASNETRRRESCNDMSSTRIMVPSYISQTASAPVILAQEKVAMELTRDTMETRAEMGNMLLERYEVCKAFSRTVNRALGQWLFAYVLSSIMYLSTCMDAVLVLQDWFGKLRVAFFFFIFIAMFFIGSEIVNKVYGLRAWLSAPANNAFLSEKNLLVLIQEITCKSIGVSGSGMFTITYSTFMTVMTTTVTFFIIILQFQKPGRDDISDSMQTLLAHLQLANITI